MSTYEYSALEKKTGSPSKGILQAESPAHARRLLRAEGLLPLALHEIKQQGEHSRKRISMQSLWQALTRPRMLAILKKEEVVLFTRQMATMIESGTPVEEALFTVAQQYDSKRIKRPIMAIRTKVLEGHSLAVALSTYSNVFPALYLATVYAGEEAGHLDQILCRLADYMENQQTLRKRLHNAMVYPLVLTTVAIAIVVFLLAFVVPKIVILFKDSEQALPLVTQGLLWISQIVQQHGLMIGLLALLGMILFKFALKNAACKQCVHHFVLKLPIIGQLIRSLNTARYARTFGLLSASGVPILEAMSTSTSVVMMIPMRQRFESAIQRVREGISIHQALLQTRYFPPMSMHLIASGEASGQLETMLQRVANNQDSEIERKLNSAIALFEPCMTLLMGGVVLFIVLSILLPIFELTQMAG